jgi:N-acetyl-1-D-myo-inositol-2-amino-2-deoxy-alpha-D-glucopyranoside deacetylase
VVGESGNGTGSEHRPLTSIDMPGLLAFHAHPDDEVTATGGTLARYADAGEQVVVITATDGSEGDVHNYENPEEVKLRLAEIRRAEIAEALEILGVEHQEFLGYKDSGMMGEPSNEHPECFWQADFEEAVGRLVRLIRKYQPEVMIIYDPFGGYGHPDHIQVHRVGLAAYYAARDLGRYPLEDNEIEWAPSKLYWTAWPRSRVRAFADARLEQGTIDKSSHERMAAAGFPDDQVTAWIDVRDRWKQKEAAWRAYRSQIPADWFMLRVADAFEEQILGREAFARVATSVACNEVEDDLFAGLR